MAQAIQQDGKMPGGEGAGAFFVRLFPRAADQAECGLPGGLYERRAR